MPSDHSRVLVSDPDVKLITQDGGTNVNNELFRNLRQVDVLREIILDLRLVGDELQDVFDRQAFILGYIEGLHLVPLNILLLSTDYRLQEVDSHVLCRKDLFVD